MPPSGPEQADIYILGEAPGAEEDRRGIQFVGPSGDMLWPQIPYDLQKRVRVNNVIRTRPPDNRDPLPIEMECCRPSVEGDVALVKPKVVIGIGLVPFTWATGFSGARMYLIRGRRFCLNIAGHPVWYFPVAHPAGLMRQRRRNEHSGELEKSLDELAWERDLETIFDTYDHLPIPDPFDVNEVDKGVDIYSGRKEGDFDKLMAFLRRSQESKLSGLDFETKNIRPYHADSKLLTIAIAIAGEAVSFAWDHPQARWSAEQKEHLKQAYLAYLRSKSRKAVHNLAFEHEWTACLFGNEILRQGLWEDTMSQAATLDERHSRQMKPGVLSLEFLIMQHFGFNLKKLTDNLDKNNLDKEPINDVLRYNAMDAKFHRLLCIRQEELLDEQDLLSSYDVKLRQVPTCVLTQKRGVIVDQAATKRLKAKYSGLVAGSEANIRSMALTKQLESKLGKPFKPGSHDHITVLLRDILHTNVGRKPDGSYSTDEEVLTEIGHPLLKAVLVWRHNSKIESTYVNPYENVYPDGMLHCTFGTVFTSTGRLQSENPNMQNQIKRDREAKEIRSQVIAGPGEVIASFDYGQIEARVLAMASRDQTFVDMLWEGYDVHREWALRIAERCHHWVKGPYQDFLAGSKKGASEADAAMFKHHRDLVKNQFVFPLFFGAGIGRISSELGLEPEEILPERKAFWRIFFGVAQWHEEMNDFYEKNGYAETLTGHHRRRYPLTFNELINEPIQGTTAEIVMNAMCRCSEKEDPIFQPFLNIHDDLTFRLPENKVDDYAEKIIEEMLNVRNKFVNVPITVEMAVGKRWDKMKDVGTFSSDKWLDWPHRRAA